MSSIGRHENLIALTEVVNRTPLIVLARQATPSWCTVLLPLEGPGFKPDTQPFKLHRARWTVTSVLKGELWPGSLIEVNAPHWEEMLHQQEQFCRAEHPLHSSPILLVTRCAELPRYDNEAEALLFLSGASPGAALELSWGLMAPVSAEAAVRALLPRSARNGGKRPWWQPW